MRNKLQVCFRRGCCLLTLAFCESARCHGDHRLDSSPEQGLVISGRKGFAAVSSLVREGSRSGALRHCLGSGHGVLSQGFPEPPRVIPSSLHLLRIHLFIPLYVPSMCDFNRDVSDCSDCQDPPLHWAPTFRHHTPKGSPRSRPSQVFHVQRVDDELLLTHCVISCEISECCGPSEQVHLQ